MNYELNLSTALVLRLIHLGENAENVRCLSDTQKEGLRRLAQELRHKLEAAE